MVTSRRTTRRLFCRSGAIFAGHSRTWREVRTTLGHDWERLETGTQGRFDETMGKMGPQATTLQIIDKPGHRVAAGEPAPLRCRGGGESESPTRVAGNDRHCDRHRTEPLGRGAPPTRTRRALECIEPSYGADRKISLVKITSEKYHTSTPQYSLLVDVGGCCLARNVGQKRRPPGGNV
jgi:hypothetical protein